MARMVRIDLHPGTRILRQFGFLALAGFLLLALCAFTGTGVFRSGLGTARLPVAGVLAALGMVSGICSLVRPAANRPLYLALTLLAYPIGVVLSHVILAALFYLVITPVGLVFRLSGRDEMHRRFEPEAGTYWVDARPERPRESYFRQF